MGLPQHNSHAKNTVTCGNNEQFFDEWKTLIKLNDGKRSARNIYKNSTDNNVPFAFGDKTNIHITESAFDITNIRKGFITVRIRETVTIPELITAQSGTPKFVDPDHILKLFIGYKASNQAVKKMTVFWNNIATKFTSDKMVEEGFAYSNLRSWSMKEKKKFIYTLYENVFKYYPSVCGTYVDLTKFQEGPTPVDIEFNIPVIDFLPLSCMSKWLKDMGSLYLETYFCETSQVVAICNPREVLDQHIYLDEITPAAPTLAGNITHFPHRFTQVRDPLIIWGSTALSGTAPNQTLTFAGSQIIRVQVADPWVHECATTIRGYGITDKAQKAIMSKLRQTPLIIPAEELQKHTFPAPVTEQGFSNTALNIPFREVSCAALVFPKTPNQITCYENPMLNGLQLKIADRDYPNKGVTTVGSRFLQEQLIIADLDGALQATEEFTNSIVSLRNDPDTGARWNNCLSDDTDFMALFETERGDAGYVFDGLDYKESNINCEIQNATPLYGGLNNTYYYPRTDATGQVDLNNHPPPPQLWLCKDTFWIHNGDTFTYHHDENLRGSQAD